MLDKIKHHGKNLLEDLLTHGEMKLKSATRS